MVSVSIRSYESPTLILLAFDWPDGANRNDFLGFAIERVPGFGDQPRSWLPNRIGFKGPHSQGKDLPSNQNPIQKFMWWDARIDDKDRGKTFTYTVTPVVGTKDNLRLLQSESSSTQVRLPQSEENGIGTYFNRAVVSSQAFSKKFRKVTSRNLKLALSWLANGIENVIPSFIRDAHSCEGAIYHLTDEEWVIPAFANYNGNLSLVYNSTRKDDSNDNVVNRLRKDSRKRFKPRSRANIMHNKFLVKLSNGVPTAVLTGSANFTTSGLTTQANLLHTFQSRELTELFLARKRLLEDDPTLAKTAKEAGWSDPISVGNARISVFFSPEPKSSRTSIDRIVSSVMNARNSILFCLFSPTDDALRKAIFEQGDAGKMMFGLVNKISQAESELQTKPNVAARARVEIYHRSRTNRDVYGYNLFRKSKEPAGFWWEVSSLPGKNTKWPVYIHHKFVVIDAETNDPVIYTGSANMSENSLHRNDENLMEIQGAPQLAEAYLAEFFRLYEHYRARVVWNKWRQGKKKNYTLADNSSWAKKAYTLGTPEYKSRINMAAA